MVTTISQRELRNNNAEIMRRVEDGETFFVTRNGKHVATLSPTRRPYVFDTDELRRKFAGTPGYSYAGLRRELDSFLDQSMDPHDE